MAGSAYQTKEDFVTKIPALKVLCNLGWQYLTPAEAMALRGSKRQVILRPVLIEVLKTRRFDYKGQLHALDEDSIEQIVRKLTNPGIQDGLLTANQRIYDDLTLGITVSQFMPDGKKHQPTIALIDWTGDWTGDGPDNNVFQVTEEFLVANSSGTGTRRPDIVGFINGLPLVVIEAKKPSGQTISQSTVADGISQNIRNQQPGEIPQLFAYSQLLMSINGSEGRYATTKTPAIHWSVWQDETFADDHFNAIKNQPLAEEYYHAMLGNKPQAARDYFDTLWSKPCVPSKQDELLIGLLSKQRLLNVIRYYLLFDRKKSKIVARYPQLFGIEALIKRINQYTPNGGREGGVFWHTTGTGKSFAMVLLCKALLLHPSLKNCRIVVVTDRTDLEKQLVNTFHSGGAFGTDIAGKRQGDAVAKVTSGKQLAKRIGQSNERIIFTLINKFNTAAKLPDCYNDSADIVVLVDEGHRSHGAENHERMKQALPKASYIAFTGTPLLKKDKTRNKFGPIIHAYTMKRAVADGCVAPLLFEERKPDLDINKKAIDNWFEKITAGLAPAQKADLKRKYDRKRTIYSAENRIELIALDIAIHFNENFKSLNNGLKGQLACENKLAAIRYKKALDDSGKVTSRIVMSPPDTREGHTDVDESQAPELQQWWKNNVKGSAKHYEKKVIEDFSCDGEPDILIVVDKLLTGFDEPRNAVLYIDKPLKDHNIIQAVARVNRLHQDKEYGLLIDYRGVLKALDTAVADYNQLEQDTLGGFDREDLLGLYRQIDTEYKRLPQLHKKLLAIFGDNENKADREWYRQRLIPQYRQDPDGDEYDARQKTRDQFYQALRDFAICLKVALSSSGFYGDKSVGEATITLYKDDLRFFNEIRLTAMQDAQQSVDYSVYDRQIKALVDKQVVANEIKEPPGVYVVNKLGKSKQAQEQAQEQAQTPEQAQQQATKAANDAAKVRGRVKKTIAEDLADDPYAQKFFSELLKKVIAETEAMFDHPFAQLARFDELEAQTNQRQTPDMPTALTGSKHAQAYYGVFKLVLGEAAFAAMNSDELQGWIDQAFAIEKTVDAAVIEHSLNPKNIENSIHQALLPTLYKTAGLDNAKTMIEYVVNITRVGLSKKGAKR